MGVRQEDSVVDMAFLVFYRVLVSTTGLESFLFGQKSSPNDFLSVDGRVRFSLL